VKSVSDHSSDSGCPRLDFLSGWPQDDLAGALDAVAKLQARHGFPSGEHMDGGVPVDVKKQHGPVPGRDFRKGMQPSPEGKIIGLDNWGRVTVEVFHLAGPNGKVHPQFRSGLDGYD
jgi:hypothetical protein